MFNFTVYVGLYNRLAAFHEFHVLDEVKGNL